MLSSIRTAGKVMRGATPSTEAERILVFGCLGLKTVRARIRAMMKSRKIKNRIAPMAIRHERFRLLGLLWLLFSGMV